MSSVIKTETKGTVFNIERYHVHDGEGIRTMIFLKGCPLRCPWCCNPESGRGEAEVAVNHNVCVGCGLCVAACPYGAIKMDGKRVRTDRQKCIACGACLEACLFGARKLYGKVMTAEEVMREIRKDEPFFRRSGGGVTFSGGEPCLQADFVRECMRLCRRERIDTAVETCGAVSYEQLVMATELASEVLFDVKTLDEETFSEFSPVTLLSVLDNLRRLAASGKKIRIRCPIIPGYNFCEEFVDGVIRLAKETGVGRVDLLPFHQLGSYKYDSLDMEYTLAGEKTLARQELEPLMARIHAAGLQGVIGG